MYLDLLVYFAISWFVIFAVILSTARKSASHLRELDSSDETN